MKYSKRSFSLAFIAFTFAFNAFSEEVPTPPPAITKLHSLVGKWTGQGEVMNEENVIVKVKAVIDCRKTAKDWGVRCENRITGPGISIIETELCGYNSETSKLHCYVVNNLGEVHNHSGNWEGENVLSLKYSGKVDNKTLTEKFRIEVIGGTTITTKATATHDGKVYTQINFSAKKAP
jgi:hypothetical protein